MEFKANETKRLGVTFLRRRFPPLSAGFPADLAGVALPWVKTRPADRSVDRLVRVGGTSDPTLAATSSTCVLGPRLASRSGHYTTERRVELEMDVYCLFNYHHRYSP
jgi:hypothetical protein